MPDVAKTLEFPVDPTLLKESNSISIHAQVSLQWTGVYLGVLAFDLVTEWFSFDSSEHASYIVP